MSVRRRPTRRAIRATARTGTVLAAVTAAVVALSLPAAGAETSVTAVAQWYEATNPQTPDSEVNATGAPFRGTQADGTVRGYIDSHTHLMSNVGFGGSIVCGATHHEHGPAQALKDCGSHGTDGSTGVLENLTNLEGNGPFDKHDTTGWPTFKDWPKWSSLTHQQMYHKWVERAWRGGQRIMVADAVNNNVLCGLPLQANKYSCDDMDTVRRQISETKNLQTFIDNQYGGPGKGWFRIAATPAQARQFVAQGKMAVIIGVEVSNPFGCTTTLGIARCSKGDIDRGLDEFKSLGVSSMFLCHKFDNALCGVRYDEGTQGVLVNVGNFINTDQWWKPTVCTGPQHDNTIANTDIPNEVLKYLPAGTALPVYPKGPHCNTKGLTDLGEYALKGMIKRGMIVEVDHMSVKSANSALDILEQQNYPGVVSSHSWMDRTFTERLYRLGGFVTPYGHSAGEYAADLHDPATAALRAKYNVGAGYGMDMNGFGGTPRPPLMARATPSADSTSNLGKSLTTTAGRGISYPFVALGGTVMDRQVSGERVWDYNKDGVAQYGQVPDWLEDVKGIGGSGIQDELAKGAESYLRTYAGAQSYSGTANLALNKPTTASSNERALFNGLAAAKATDGRIDTRWASGNWGTAPQWLRVDLGSRRQIGRVAIDWEKAYAKGYQVQVSDDGATWRTVSTVTDGDGALDVHVFNEPGKTMPAARYIRVHATERATNYGYSIEELQVFTD
ncbi:hypothetical protein EU513_03205 [Yimella sp. RIT 621]|uniref:discoidin domain-containing protein n=1 Tax=Yimella sp. RIT 621 TaxID=2510323 RepID=UPI00101C70D7|nr:discoidin domain-containing protein [Yimella sp. RIT 621]RYG78623.1 hypothetical protein EU513_03205 [Yimella sp. RIT 621]